MSVDAIYAATTFYALQAIKVLLSSAEFGRHSAEKLEYDVLEYERQFINKLSTMLFDYSAMVVFGEMRHAQRQCDVYIQDVPQCRERSKSYSEAINYDPYSILHAGIKQFDRAWSHSFGGRPWQMISKISAQRNNMNDILYCDTCFSLSHNTSPYLNKYETKIFKISDVGDYKDFLDSKFIYTPETLLDIIQRKFCYTIFKFVERLKNLGFTKIQLIDYSDNRADKTESKILSYVPVNWGNKILCPIFLPSSEYEDEYGDEEERYYEYDDEEEECA